MWHASRTADGTTTPFPSHAVICTPCLCPMECAPNCQRSKRSFDCTRFRVGAASFALETDSASVKARAASLSPPSASPTSASPTSALVSSSAVARSLSLGYVQCRPAGGPSNNCFTYYKSGGPMVRAQSLHSKTESSLRYTKG